ncbi:MAG: hypothetical protein M1825_003624 [Sarcosagium campestre]|nr:MAG: hypothetical protein M1825_003624 [Sarcosagium campestre]
MVLVLSVVAAVLALIPSLIWAVVIDDSSCDKFMQEAIDEAIEEIAHMASRAYQRLDPSIRDPDVTPFFTALFGHGGFEEVREKGGHSTDWLKIYCNEDHLIYYPGNIIKKAGWWDTNSGKVFEDETTTLDAYTLRRERYCDKPWHDSHVERLQAFITHGESVILCPEWREILKDDSALPLEIIALESLSGDSEKYLGRDIDTFEPLSVAIFHLLLHSHLMPRDTYLLEDLFVTKNGEVIGTEDFPPDDVDIDDGIFALGFDPCSKIAQLSIQNPSHGDIPLLNADNYVILAKGLFMSWFTWNTGRAVVESLSEARGMDIGAARQIEAAQSGEVNNYNSYDNLLHRSGPWYDLLRALHEGRDDARSPNPNPSPALERWSSHSVDTAESANTPPKGSGSVRRRAASFRTSGHEAT